MSDYPEDLKYSTEHEWVRSGNGSSVRVGITEYAADQLGDIVFVSLPAVGDTVSAGDACGELESTKSVSDIFCPVPGVITAVNPLLEANPETINAIRTGTAGSSSWSWTRVRIWTTYWMLIPTPNRWEAKSTAS